MIIPWEQCHDSRGHRTIWWEATLRGESLSLRLAASEQGEWMVSAFGQGILGAATIARGHADASLPDAQEAAADAARKIVQGLAEQLRADERITKALSTLGSEYAPAPGWEDEVLEAVTRAELAG